MEAGVRGIEREDWRVTLETGIHDGIPAEEYHRDPAPEPSLSNSVAQILLARSPLHAWCAHPRLNPDHENDESQDFDFGTAAHSVLLENDDSCIVEIECDSYRTKVAQEARDAAREAGKVPLLAHQANKVRRMVEVARNAIQQTDLRDTFADGKPEQTLIWQDGGVWCRARVDWLNPARPWDYKSTTDAEPSAFGRHIASMQYDFQLAFYQRGLRALGINAQMCLLAQEKKEPFDITVHALAASKQDYVDALVTRAIGIWCECLQSGSWPGYDKRTHYQEITNWQMADYERMFIESEI